MSKCQSAICKQSNLFYHKTLGQTEWCFALIYAIRRFIFYHENNEVLRGQPSSYATIITPENTTSWHITWQRRKYNTIARRFKNYQYICCEKYVGCWNVSEKISLQNINEVFYLHVQPACPCEHWTHNPRGLIYISSPNLIGCPSLFVGYQYI